MPVTVRRFIYSLLAALGFALMVPFIVNVHRIQADLLADPAAVEAALSSGGAAWAERLLLLFLLGLVLATGFLYAALSSGYGRSWRPLENGTPRCGRCAAELRFGLTRCPSCDQQLAW